MEYQQSDTNTNSQSAIGVGRAEQLVRSLHELQPSWVADGHGIRGPQEPRNRPPTVRPEPMEFGLPTGSRASSPEAGGSRQLTVTDGTVTVNSVVKISFDGSVFEVVDSGNGEAHVQCAS